jgi:hypothetical protein
VTEGPQHLIAVAVVVLVYRLVVEPDALEGVGGVLRGNPNSPLAVGTLAVGVAVAPRDPRPLGALHHGVETRGQTADRALDLDFGSVGVGGVGVTVRLSVRDDDQLLGRSQSVVGGLVASHSTTPKSRVLLS